MEPRINTFEDTSSLMSASVDGQNLQLSEQLADAANSSACVGQQKR